jgi:hypothetical protein
MLKNIGQNLQMADSYHSDENEEKDTIKKVHGRTDQASKVNAYPW